ncbi:flavin-containing monooxygenase [Sphingomonas colocasiae]|uniref:NAD(P)/FAD-dependent oxidoreductase n=1 Tax=Sphingomonas colocasiae TaxID=1848973 RepID=A0ABS7PXD4_9SPHN|nr:NAD(P)/FAD-dependent oxidoreductase [Sphingomonas colocasiae]MBY8825619.1 NAD(P)/FAD-dependent oxidoreductase [Sphingomonas colocasiae]
MADRRHEDDGILDVLVLGGGFGGLHSLYRLREDGHRVLVLEAAPDVGGAWYWNRYPGARCDVESLVYCYTFSPVIDAEWRWSERYAARDEIVRYLRWVSERLDLRKDIRFDSRLAKAHYDAADNLWNFETEGGDRYRARHFLSAAGPISAPIMPDIPGLDRFQGDIIHTARWPEAYPDFAGKRVGIIGTGSSGTQVIPIVAQQCEKLTVFLRTPNFYSPARNRPLTDADHQWWQQNRDLTRERLQQGRRWGGGDIMLDDEINDAMFEPASNFTTERRREIYEARYANGGGVVGWAFADAMVSVDANEEAGDFLREKVRDAIVDPAIADKLTPRGFAYGTKRVTVGTDFPETFNRDNVELVDVKTETLEGFNERGAIVAGREIALDYLIAASGFDALTGALTTIDVRGKDGRSLGEIWADGPQTYLGISVLGFPNMYMIGGPGSPSVLTNVVMTNEMQVEWIADLINHVEDNGYVRCEATAEAQNEWTEKVGALVRGNLWETAESWYVGANVPGKPRVILAYAGGYTAYKAECAEISAAGYPGYRFTTENGH